MARARRAEIAPDPDAEPTVPVVVGKSRPFALACLKEWRKRDGVDRSWMLHNISIDVPAEIVATASETLKRARQ